MRKNTVIECEYQEIEDIIKSTYGRDFDLINDLECCNDTQHTFTVEKGKNEKYEWNKNKLARWIETGEGNFITCMILDDLCDKGVLEPGEYLINVSW